MTIRLLLCATISCVLTGCATAPRPAPQPGLDATIPFLSHRGVDNWAADGDRAVYLQDSFRRWYRATLFGPCTELNFATAIGIETRGNDTLDRFGAILVRGQRCQIDRLVTSGPPPKALRRRKGATEAKADKQDDPR